MKHLQFILIFFFFLTFNFFISAKSKKNENKSYTCADEIGPKLEFTIPNFKNNLDDENISIKFYKTTDRKLVSLNNGKIKKKTSPIDRSYFFYAVNFIVKEENSAKFYFEFFPPSHLMIQSNGGTFTSLVCWE